MIYSFVRFFFLLVVVNFFYGLQTVLMEKLMLRSDYKQGNKAQENAYHEVVFAIKQQNLEQLEKLWYEVSDPKNSKFGQFLSREEVATLTANSKATEFVTNYLIAHGVTITRKTPHGEYIKARARVGTWENLLATQFFEFRPENPQKKSVLRALEYSLPVELTEHVQGVFNTVHFPNVIAPKAKHEALTSGPGVRKTITPASLNEYYHIPSNTGNNLASQSLYESLEQYYSPNDLSQFESSYGVPQQEIAYDIGGYVSDDLCVTDANNCAEANLDVQYMIAVSQVTPTTYWYNGDPDSFLSWIQDVAAMENPPLVHSISYSGIENSIPSIFLNSFNTEAQKLGVQGVSIFVSSGDDGVASFQARSSAKKCGYVPNFPCTSPYVTAVGATQGPESGTEEIACTSDQGGSITTGGGFSDVIPAPSYQKAAISAYFKALNSSQQPTTGYSTTGRGYPDIYVAGYTYEVIIGGKMYPVSGTSASTPVVAGMVSLVNAARLKAGKKPLGNINQAIYQNGDKIILHDVTKGFNNCCASKVCCDEGFYASAGWDPLTGFGSVDFQKFFDVFYNL
jgi:tripeptidyl-peptidase-1